MAKNTGARGLRAILENILTEAMFEVYWIMGSSIVQFVYVIRNWEDFYLSFLLYILNPI